MVVKKRDYPPPKFVVCHNDHSHSMVPVCPINGEKIVSGSPPFQSCLFRVLCLFDALFEGIFNGVPVHDSYACVVFTEIFVREDSNVFIVWVPFNLIIRSSRESIRAIGSTWFVF